MHKLGQTMNLNDVRELDCMALNTHLSTHVKKHQLPKKQILSGFTNKLIPLVCIVVHMKAILMAVYSLLMKVITKLSFKPVRHSYRKEMLRLTTGLVKKSTGRVLLLKKTSDIITDRHNRLPKCNFLCSDSDGVITDESSEVYIDKILNGTHAYRFLNCKGQFKWFKWLVQKFLCIAPPPRWKLDIPKVTLVCQFRPRRDAAWPITTVLPISSDTFCSGGHNMVRFLDTPPSLPQLSIAVILGVFKQTVIWRFSWDQNGINMGLQYGKRKGSIAEGVCLLKFDGKVYNRTYIIDATEPVSLQGYVRSSEEEIPVYTHGSPAEFTTENETMTALVPWLPIPYDKVTDVVVSNPGYDAYNPDVCKGSVSTFTGNESLRDSFTEIRQLPLRFQATLLSRTYYAFPSQSNVCFEYLATHGFMPVSTFIYEESTKREQLAVIVARREAAEEALRVLIMKKRELEAAIDLYVSLLEEPSESRFFYVCCVNKRKRPIYMVQHSTIQSHDTWRFAQHTLMWQSLNN